jgi:hypothetical protein
LRDEATCKADSRTLPTLRATTQTRMDAPFQHTKLGPVT